MNSTPDPPGLGPLRRPAAPPPGPQAICCTATGTGGEGGHPPKHTPPHRHCTAGGKHMTTHANYFFGGGREQSFHLAAFWLLFFPPKRGAAPPPPQHRAPCVYVVRAKGDPKEMGPGGHRGGGGRQGPGGWGPNEASPRRLVLRLGLDAASGGWGGTLRTGASGFARLGGRGAGQQSLAWLKSHFWRGKAKREAEETKPGGTGSCRAPSRARSGGRLVRTGTVG